MTTILENGHVAARVPRRLTLPGALKILPWLLLAYATACRDTPTSPMVREVRSRPGRPVTSDVSPASSFSTIGSMTLPVASAAYAVMNNELYTVGGFNSCCSRTNATQAFDPGSLVWHTKSPAPYTYQFGGTNSAVVNGVLYVMGGTVGGYCTSAAYSYNPASDAWTAIAGLPEERCHAAAAAANGRVYVFGGTNTSGAAEYTTVDVYDPVKNQWSLAANNSPVGWSQPGAGAIGNVIYVVGGGVNKGAPSSAAYAFDVTTQTWSAIASMQLARALPAVVTVGGKLWVIGGLLPPSANVATTETEIYDPPTNTWTVGPSLPASRGGMSAGVINGVIYAAGGMDGSSNAPYPDVFAIGLATPIVTPTVSGTLGSNGWYTSDVSVTWNVDGQGLAISSSTGCAAVSVTKDTPGTTYTCSATSLGGTTTQSVTIKRDATVPVISAAVTGTLGNQGWYRSNVGIAWSVKGGVSNIASQTPACAGSTLSTDTDLNGATFTCSATSTAGLQGTATITVTRDATSPVVTYTGNAGTYTVDQTVAITCSAADPSPGSGLASATCANISGAAWSFTIGTNASSANATDVAGNVGSGSVSFTVRVTASSLGNLAARMCSSRGIGTSLAAKLNAAAASIGAGNTRAASGQIGAFINEVQAQSGKACSPADAATLIRLANLLLP